MTVGSVIGGARGDSEVDKLVERLDDGVSEDVEGERGEVLERVHHGVDEVVVELASVQQSDFRFQ